MPNGPRWFEQPPPEPRLQPRKTSPTPDNLWVRCEGCRVVLYKEELDASLQVCTRCGHHLRVDALTRLEAIVDPDSLQFLDEDIAPTDPLHFVDSRSYARRLQATQQKVGAKDAYIAAAARIDGRAVQIGSFDFRFMGGSMGSVVGEKITRQFERATALRQPAIVISASGGARMQEGVLSLMQMAKTCAALARSLSLLLDTPP